MGRLRILMLLMSLLALATTLAACGSGGGSSDEAPSKVLETATLDGVNSADLNLALAVTSEGKDNTDLDIALAGPIERKGKELPRLDLTATVEGTANDEDIDFEGGLTLLSNNGFVNYKGTEYEIDPSTFSFAKSSFLATKRKKGKEPTTYAVNECQEAAASLAVSELGKNLSNDGSADVEGTETTKISGDLDVPAALDAIIELTEEASCDVQLRAAGVEPEELKEARKEITGAVKEAHVEVYVGDDDIIRRLVANLTAEPQDGDFDMFETAFELSLAKVNEKQEINAPAESKSVSVLLRKLGINPLELLSSGAGLSTLLEKFGEDAFPSLGR